MTTSELMTCTHPQAIYELAWRTILTLLRSNRTCSDPVKRWYLDEEVIFQLLQKDRSAIRRCVRHYQQEIDEHHHELNLTAACNAKSVAVTEVIALAEHASLFREDDLLV